MAKDKGDKNRTRIDIFLSFLPHLLVIILSVSSFAFVIKFEILFKDYLEFLRIIIWPLVLLFALLFFKKVFLYLFLSLREFNFFGNRGELKNPTELIEEKARALYELDKEKATREEKEELVKIELENIGKESKEGKDIAGRAVKVAEKLLEDNKELSNKIEELSRSPNVTISVVDAICALFGCDEDQRKALMSLVKDENK